MRWTAFALTFHASAAAAAEPATAAVAPHLVADPTPPQDESEVEELSSAPPPPTNVVYFQYGVALTATTISSPGPICDTALPCILGNGGGIAVRAAWRGTGPLYLGGVYEIAKLDPNKLYRLALLQQARAEARYYWQTARVTEPYLNLGLGISGYGNEGAIDSWGPSGAFGIGVEYQLTRQTVVGAALSYRLLYFSRFTDTSGTDRPPGIAQLVGLDLVLEQRDPIFTAGARDRDPTKTARAQ